jgi:tellurite resistance protein
VEGWIIWILIVVGFAVFRHISQENETKEVIETLTSNKLTIKVKEEIPPKDVGIKVKCFGIKIKGWIGNPTEDQSKIILTIYDNTDSPDDDFGMPVLSAHPAFCEKNSRVFGVDVIWKTTADTYLTDFFNWIYIPKDIILSPKKGKRKLKFHLTVCETDTEVKHSSYEDLSKIKHNASTFVNFNFQEVGYMDELINKDKVEDLTIQLGMSMAAADGSLDQKELNIIKKWAQSLTDELEKDKADEKKKHFSSFIKKTYSAVKDKKVSLSNLVKDFNNKAGKGQKYLAIQLMLDIAGADGKLSKEEIVFINKIAKTTGIDLDTFKEMKNKVIANVDKIDMSESPSEETFGITKDMDEKEKCKLLRKEFTKWNNQTTNKNPQRRKRAKEMIKIVAELRKKYDC